MKKQLKIGDWVRLKWHHDFTTNQIEKGIVGVIIQTFKGDNNCGCLIKLTNGIYIYAQQHQLEKTTEEEVLLDAI